MEDIILLGSLKSWIIVTTDNLKAIYKNVAKCAELLNWQTKPVLIYEKEAPVIAKVYG